MEYSPKERVSILAIGGMGFFIVNIAFIYGLVAKPEALTEALANPISLAFILEALVLMFFWAYFLRRWKVTTMSMTMFVFLSLLGSMAFALPFALLRRSNSSEHS